MLSEEAKVPGRVLREIRTIEQAIELITRAFRQRGRLFYAGAGTSGRLGALDASECPPTFQTPPAQVQALIAGGLVALGKSTESAEDDSQAGAAAIRAKRVGARDVVVGIAASGTTPFVWGALDEARQRRAKTILVCFNPHLKFPRGCRPSVVIAPEVGPEVLTGSTRLKAGTATKLILNLFTTLSMVRLGKVRSNLMVDLNPSNSKLKDRAVRIARELTGATEAQTRLILEKHRWSVRRALDELANLSASVSKRHVLNSR
jgi:N-acetylmuramic acid 6-phosphate etherase